MAFTGFRKKDFNIFQINGLEKRMEAIQTQIQPKFEAISKKILPVLSGLTDEEMFTHIARHARRTVNPPDDTWVAFSSSRRGYKKHPHFQFGLWQSHLFIWFAMIYESPYKQEAARVYSKHTSELYSAIPEGFYWSDDHMKPAVMPQNELSRADLNNLIQRLENVKKAELLCGKIIPYEEAIQLSGKEITDIILSTYKTVLPLYKMAKQSITV